MNITQDLIKDHLLIADYIQLMQVCMKAREGDDYPLLMEHTGLFIDFIRFFNDEFHHWKEENILFRRLLALDHIFPMEDISRMVKEHELARDILQELREAYQNSDAQGILAPLENYTYVILSHIYRENSSLFPLIEDNISLAEKTSILHEYQELEAKKDGSRLRQHYESKRDELRALLINHQSDPETDSITAV